MRSLAAAIADQFAALFVVPGGSLYWLDLVGALVIATCIYLCSSSQRKFGALSLRGSLGFVFPGRIYNNASTKLDFRYCLINVVLYAVIVGPMVVTSGAAARFALRTMVSTLGVPQSPLPGGLPANLLATALVFIASDFGFFIAHYLQHKVPLLWEFHKVHHSAEVLQPITSFRAHPVDQFVSGSVTGLTTGLAMAVIAYCFDARLTMVTILGTNVLVVLWNAAGSHLRHSHIWWSFGPSVSKVLVSPAMHQIHHSTASLHLNKNFGGTLSVWDGFLLTRYVPQAFEKLTLGLADKERSDFKTVLDLYVRPLRTLSNNLLRGSSCPPPPGHTEPRGTGSEIV